MSRYERTAKRSLIYSKWHRFYCGDAEPMIDLDAVEYCKMCDRPLALIETARDVGQASKSTYVMRLLAELADIPALCVLYHVRDGVGEQGCDCRSINQQMSGCDHGIDWFRVRRVWPARLPLPAFRKVTPDEYYNMLKDIRFDHIATAMDWSRINFKGAEGSCRAYGR